MLDFVLKDPFCNALDFAQIEVLTRISRRVTVTSSIKRKHVAMSLKANGAVTNARFRRHVGGSYNLSIDCHF
jgi:hypothetical protein